MKSQVISSFFVAGFIFTSCRIEPKEKHGPLHIVTTTGIIADGIERIVGDSAEVSCIMGPGTDPHIYKPAPGDIDLLEKADVIICNGLHLEGKMAEMLDKYSKEKPVLKMSDGIEEKLLLKSADVADSYDPHIWFDTELWVGGLDYVTNQLGSIDTGSAEYFHNNFLLYAEEILETEIWIQNEIRQLDSMQKVLITSHDAFSYFGRKYGIEVKGIQGVSTLSEVGLKDISDMVEFIIQRNIPSIFVETSTSQKTAQSILDGCAAKNYTVQLAGPLYSDALGEPDTDAGTYTGMLRENVRMIVNSLTK